MLKHDVIDDGWLLIAESKSKGILISAKPPFQGKHRDKNISPHPNFSKKTPSKREHRKRGRIPRSRLLGVPSLMLVGFFGYQ
jgi:hypothetical protein